MKPYIAMHAPPITHLGTMLMIATNGDTNDTSMHIIAVVKIV